MGQGLFNVLTLGYVMLKKLPSYISILAALLVIIMGFAFNKTPYEIVIRLIIIISMAYIAGVVVRAYLVKNVFPEPEIPVDEESLENGGENGRENQEDEFEPVDDDFAD